MATNFKLIDHRIPYRSKLDANYNQDVNLFVREYDGTKNPDDIRKCVLMIHGRSSPALTTFDLGYDNRDWDKYSWAQELAKDGNDVFMLDFQGSGYSPLAQLEDPCNTLKTAEQQGVLFPNPLTPNVEYNPSYPYKLQTSQSEWAELHTVVDFIIKKRSVQKVTLISYSAGAWAVGPYAVKHPEKVESVMLVAPIFPPSGFTYAPTSPEDGVPMFLQTKDEFKNSWNAVDCPDQKENGIVDFVWNSLMKIDRIGSGWGKIVDGSPIGVLRYRNATRWGWNSTTVGLGPTTGPLGPTLEPTLGYSVPVCIIYGKEDNLIETLRPTPTGTIGFSVKKLYEAIPGDKKLMFEIACATHYLAWEKRVYKDLHKFCKQWLKHFKVENRLTGKYSYKDGSTSDL